MPGCYNHQQGANCSVLPAPAAAVSNTVFLKELLPWFDLWGQISVGPHLQKTSVLSESWFTKIHVLALIPSHSCLKGAKMPFWPLVCGLLCAELCEWRLQQGPQAAGPHRGCSSPVLALLTNGKDCTLIYLAQKGSLKQSSEMTVYQGELGWRLQENSQLLAILSIQGMIIRYT